MVLPTKRKRQRYGSAVSRTAGIAALTLGLLVLSACAPRTTYWSPAESPKKNQVSWAEFHHPVRFAGASVAISPEEQEALTRFLHRVARGQGVVLMLAAGPDDNARLGQNRETALAEFLRVRGYSVLLTEQATGSPYRNDGVRVTVGRYVVRPPDCPDWSKSATGDPANQVTSNFGCASETNLGLMVANPGVLLRGVDELGPADGEAIAVGIKNYREGNIEKAEPITALEIESGIRSGGGQD